MTTDPKDLIVLVPGKNEEAAVNAILARPAALGIRQITPIIERHRDSDPGCRNSAADYLRSSIRLFAHALVVFDRESCGAETLSREHLEQELEGRLSRSGWGDRAAAVVISPELEAWVWSDSPQVDIALGWAAVNRLFANGCGSRVSSDPMRSSPGVRRKPWRQPWRW